MGKGEGKGRAKDKWLAAAMETVRAILLVGANARRDVLVPARARRTWYDTSTLDDLLMASGTDGFILVCVPRWPGHARPCRNVLLACI